MKIKRFCFPVLLMAVASLWLVPKSSPAGQKYFSVQIRNGQLRSTPGYFSRVIAKLNYADPVTILQKQGDWLKVATANGRATGWLHKSALTKKRLKLSAGGRDIANTVSTDEQALAGKGFNSDVEAQFKKENRNINYTWVNRMEAIKIPPNRLMIFLKEGNIHSRREVAR